MAVNIGRFYNKKTGEKSNIFALNLPMKSGVRQKSIHHRGNLHFLFSGSDASMLYTLLSGPMVYPFSLVFQGNGTPQMFLLCDLGSEDRPRHEGCTGGFYSFSHAVASKDTELIHTDSQKSNVYLYLR